MQRANLDKPSTAEKNLDFSGILLVLGVRSRLFEVGVGIVAVASNATISDDLVSLVTATSSNCSTISSGFDKFVTLLLVCVASPEKNASSNSFSFIYWDWENWESLFKTILQGISTNGTLPSSP